MLFILNGCSTKEIYEPKIVTSSWKNYIQRESSIVDVSSNVALLDNKKVLSVYGDTNVTVDSNHRVLSQSNEWILSATIDGNLTLVNTKDSTKSKKFELKHTIASASTAGNTLAVLFADNEMALYDLDSKKLTFKAEGGNSLAVDSRIVPPYFKDDLVLFPTLDGKVVIVNAALHKKLSTIIVSSKEHFNNIIYLQNIDNKIVAATSTEIIAFSGQQDIRVQYEARDISYDGENIFLTTKQGELVSLTKNLDLNRKIKFPFAHFLALMPLKNRLYLIEKGGYLIVVDKDMKEYKVYEVSLDDGFTFNLENAFVVDNKQIMIEPSKNVK